tara:strand:- start:22 stop:225 length:204 start_codon:yes stop_codon:yes gene_type:complete
MAFQLRSGKSPSFKKLGSKKTSFKKKKKSPFYSDVFGNKAKTKKAKTEGYVKNNPMNISNSMKELEE